MASVNTPLNVVIIGGSLSGLMCGIALKHAGHTVTILEKGHDERQSHMAGVCLGLDAQYFLSHHDRHTKVFFHTCLRIQALKKDESIQVFVNARRDITSWDTLYFRLRSLFDGYSSSFYPLPAQPASTDGSFTYKADTQVEDIEVTQDGPGSPVALTILDRNSRKVSEIRADVVIGADGPDSLVRAKYLPEVKRRYVGYVAWRGTVPESEISPAAREVFKRSATVHMMHRHHCIAYTIPGVDGSLVPGERYVNFLWYTNETTESLDEILRDGVDGHRHHNIVPAGRVREDVWRARVDYAKAIPLAAPFLEVVTRIRRPFIQVITDFCAPRAAFEGGRVLLVGDALSLFRPHTAFSGTQAAFHALRTAELLGGRIALPEWEEQVLRYSRVHWLQSIWFGDFYQSPLAFALVSAIRYWVYCGFDKLKAWWHGEAPLLRGTSYRVLEYDD